MLASLVLKTVDHRQHHLNALRSGLSVVVYPLQVLVDLPSAAAHWASENLLTRSALQDENQRLRSRALLLEMRLQKFHALEAENTRLRELLNSTGKPGEQVLIAELLSVDQDPFRRRILLNKGSRDGVFNGQPLLDAHGVLGQVVETMPFSSQALLVTDPSHAIPVQFNRSGLRAIALGTGEVNRLEIPHIPNNADIQVGDLLVTSGLGQRFPPGYPVGTIVEFEKDPSQPFAHVIAEPAAHLERSREVVLIMRQETEEP
jgi:rod shape-determining protein MreC